MSTTNPLTAATLAVGDALLKHGERSPEHVAALAAYRKALLGDAATGDEFRDAAKLNGVRFAPQGQRTLDEVVAASAAAGNADARALLDKGKP